MTSYVFWPTMWPSSGMENTKCGYIAEHKMKWPHGWLKHMRRSQCIHTNFNALVCMCWYYYYIYIYIYIYIYKLAHYSLTFRNESLNNLKLSSWHMNFNTNITVLLLKNAVIGQLECTHMQCNAQPIKPIK
jgi:hypothetical protein